MSKNGKDFGKSMTQKPTLFAFSGSKFSYLLTKNIRRLFRRIAIRISQTIGQQFRFSNAAPTTCYSTIHIDADAFAASNTWRIIGDK